MTVLHHLNFCVRTIMYPSLITSRYLQIRSFASKHFPSHPSFPSTDLMYSVLSVNLLNKGAKSKIYALILNSCPHTWGTPRQRGREKLEKLCQKTPGNTAHIYSIQHTHTSSLCIRHGLTQFNPLTAVFGIVGGEPKFSHHHRNAGMPPGCGMGVYNIKKYLTIDVNVFDMQKW